MPNDNGQKEETKVKTCPFLNKYCIGARCTLHMEMQRQMGTVAQKFGMCSFNAMVIVLSEMNAKSSIQQNPMRLPKDLILGR